MLINFVAFQIGWFSSVVGAARQMPWLGPVAFVLVLALHLRSARRPGAEVMLVIACGTIGLFFESALVLAGWVTYPSGFFNELLAPYWIITMWMLFGTTLNLSMGWLKGRPLLAAGLGAVAGPASYVAGQKLGGIVFLEFVPAIAALAIGWAVFMPLLMLLAERFDGMSKQLVTQQSSR